MKKRKNTSKKILSILLCIGLILGWLPFAPTVEAKVKYETLAFDKKLEKAGDFEVGKFEKVKMKKLEKGVELELAEAQRGEYISPEVSAHFGATHIGVHWSENSSQENLLIVSIRTRGDGEEFGDWEELSVQLDDRPDGRQSEEIFASLVAVESKNHAQAKVEFVSSGGKDPKLKNLTFTFLNSGEESKKVSKKLSLAPKTTAAGVGVLKTSIGGQKVNVISREDWGANEAYRFKDGQEDWPRSYHGTRKLVVHHTAVKGSNGVTDLEKNKEAVRSTYYYHAVSQGWGDIGYNALVDAAGNVYEGRYGTREVATRQDPPVEQVMVMDVEAGHTAGYNSGSFGVSAMGDFTRYTPPQAQLEGLKKVLAYAADERGVNVQGSSDFRRYNGTWHPDMNNVIGHRDATSTGCPGQKLYDQMQSIKNSVDALLHHNLSVFDATLNGVDIEGAKVESGNLNFGWSAFTDDDTLQAASGYEYMIERVFGRPGVASDSQPWETAWFFPENSHANTTEQTATQVSVGSLQSNSNYVFYVRALDGTGKPLSTTKHVNFETGNVVPDEPTEPDVTAPEVSIVSPTEGADISGLVQINASATDNVGVARVDFYVGESLVGSDSNAPFAVDWDSTSVVNGPVVISAKAFDVAGNQGVSAGVNATVQNPVPDTEAPSTPANLSAVAVSETQINLVWDASVDNVGVAGYEIFRDGSPIATVTSVGFEDKNLQPATQYSYAVRAFDAAGNQSALSQVAFATTLEKQVDSEAPTVEILSPSEGSTVSKVAQISASATDNVGVSGMEIWLDGSLVASGSGGSLSYSWNTRKSSTGNHTISARAFDAAGNESTQSINVNVVR